MQSKTLTNKKQRGLNHSNKVWGYYLNSLNILRQNICNSSDNYVRSCLCYLLGADILIYLEPSTLNPELYSLNSERFRVWGLGV